MENTTETKLFDSVLHVGINVPYFTKYFKKHSKVYHYIDTGGVKDANWLNNEILRINDKIRPNLNFFQIQHNSIITGATIKQLHGVSVNWTGDVREIIPQVFRDTGKFFDCNMLTNTTDIDKLKEMGIHANYFQIAPDGEVYAKEYMVNEAVKVNGEEIVFLGNNYHSTFPLSVLRKQMVDSLYKTYGNKFGVYGIGWNGYNARSINNNHDAEVLVYRNCKIAINLSHFDYKRYSSDRIFRIMGSGAFCLTKWYPEIELDFTDGEHLVVWTDIEDLHQKIEYYLKDENQEERLRIAENGYNLVHSLHTWDLRMYELKEIIQHHRKYNRKLN